MVVNLLGLMERGRGERETRGRQSISAPTARMPIAGPEHLGGEIGQPQRLNARENGIKRVKDNLEQEGVILKKELGGNLQN